MIEKTDKSYWVDYYKSGVAPEEPSAFAKHIEQEYLQGGMSVIELGCGNGRDSRYLASKGVSVVAIDQVVSEINELTYKHRNMNNLKFRVGDFTRLEVEKNSFDTVYSRFTLHSVSKEGQNRVLRWSNTSLKPGGYLCIETRGKMNELYKKGLPVNNEEDAYVYDDHYRRFVELESFMGEVTKAGFILLEAHEKTGFAPYEDTDHHFIRIVARKT